MDGHRAQEPNSGYWLGPPLPRSTKKKKVTVIACAFKSSLFNSIMVPKKQSTVSYSNIGSIGYRSRVIYTKRSKGSVLIYFAKTGK